MENDLRKLALTYSRGFSDGFLGGSDHQTLVEGRFPKHRGILLGKVISVAAGQRTVTVERQERPWTGGNVLRNERTRAQGEKRKLRVLTDETLTNVPLSPRAGMGIVFDEGRPEENEEGGPIFAVEESGSRITLRFGQPGPDLSRVRVGQLVWVTSDPTIAKNVRKAARAKEEIDLLVQGQVFEAWRCAVVPQFDRVFLHQNPRIATVVERADELVGDSQASINHLFNHRYVV